MRRNVGLNWYLHPRATFENLEHDVELGPFHSNNVMSKAKPRDEVVGEEWHSLFSIASDREPLSANRPLALFLVYESWSGLWCSSAILKVSDYVRNHDFQKRINR
ncbi:hypothetical protein TNCV_1967301 [Trichonephila clavipes]|nr:hypothetical protein TNCV_1967301 [Trichonephila clavipes]